MTDKKNAIVALAASAALLLFSCEEKREKKMEQLTATEFSDNDTTSYPLSGKATFGQLNSSINSVLLTGMDNIRLINIYKVKPGTEKNIDREEYSSYHQKINENDGSISHAEDDFNYFMPGMDVISGYNLINVAHYDMAKGRLSYFFGKPVLVRNLYFPGVKKDSLRGLPISRDFFLASVYDEDTNRDSLINKKDLRRLYHFDKHNRTKTSLLPQGYSSIRSTYDYRNDAMFVYARYDSNKNGASEKTEPISIFWIDLKNPTLARRMI